MKLDLRRTYLRDEIGYLSDQIVRASGDKEVLRAHQARLQGQLLESAKEYNIWGREGLRRLTWFCAFANATITVALGLFLVIIR